MLEYNDDPESVFDVHDDYFDPEPDDEGHVGTYESIEPPRYSSSQESRFSREEREKNWTLMQNFNGTDQFDYDRFNKFFQFMKNQQNNQVCKILLFIRKMYIM